MNLEATLTKRESQMAGLLAIGKPKKIIACELYVSPRTVENTARNIYEKTEVNNAVELSNWWVCKKFGITPSELYNMALSLLFIFMIGVNEVNVKDTAVRVRTCRVKTKRKDNNC